MRFFSLALIAALALGISAISPVGAAAASRGKLYIIGVGPAGPQTATLQALETIKKMDGIIAQPWHAKLFAGYIGDTPIIFDHLDGLWSYKNTFFTQLPPQDLKTFKQLRKKATRERIARINSLLAQGKNLGMLESGNPCLFSSSHWYAERLDPKDLVFIAGMGSDAAAMAALGKSVIPAFDTRFVMQTAPFIITDESSQHVQAFKDISKYHPTMIFYMALKKPEPFFRALSEALGGDVPCAAVYRAGYADKERVIKGNLGNMAAKLAGEKDGNFGILFVGRFLEGKPYLAVEDKP